MNFFSYLCFILLLLGQSCTHITQDSSSYKICTEDKERQKARSSELKKLVEEDQNDRKGGTMSPGSVFRDRARRMRVAEIFAEGCFLSAEDFFSSALIFQHGDKSEHYFQALIWFKESYEKEPSQQKKKMIALAADRYLVSKGHKQLFTSQAFLPSQESCWCLQPVENSVSKEFRQEYMGEESSLEKQKEWLDHLNQGKKCSTKIFCDTALKPSPKGILIGLW